MTQHPIEEITWRDASVEMEELRADEMGACKIVRTIGIVVHDQLDRISIAAEELDDGGGGITYRCTTHIHPADVIARRVLA